MADHVRRGIDADHVRVLATAYELDEQVARPGSDVEDFAVAWQLCQDLPGRRSVKPAEGNRRHPVVPGGVAPDENHAFGASAVHHARRVGHARQEPAAPRISRAGTVSSSAMTLWSAARGRGRA